MRLVYDETAMLSLIQKELERNKIKTQIHDISSEQLQIIIKNCQKFNWSHAAQHGSINRKQLYFWFFGTYMRRQKQQIEGNDLILLKQEVHQVYVRGLNVDCQTKNRIAKMLSQHYDRQILDIAFSNAKAYTQKLMKSKNQEEQLVSPFSFVVFDFV